MSRGQRTRDHAPVSDVRHPEIVLAAHLPLLRVDAESLPFAGGDLWRMPFEAFDQLTVGAFADHRAAYEAVAPVFYRLVVSPARSPLQPVPPGQPPGRRLQLKVASGDTSVPALAGLELLNVFHREAVTPAWLALLLHHPDAALPRPDWSVTFAVADEGFGFVHQGEVIRIAQLQGDADLDYLLTEGFATTTLDAADAPGVSAWTERLSAGTTLDADLWPALDALAACSSPLLSADDRGALATAALESLLLPDLRRGLARTLARRTAALLAGPDVARGRDLQAQVRALYDARSAVVHGEDRTPPAGTAGPDLGAPLLAAAVLALDAQAQATGIAVPALADRLDEATPATATTAASQPVQVPRPWQAPLQRRRTGQTGLVGTNLASQDGQWLLWAPLAGLHTREPMTLDGTAAHMLLPLTGAELLSLEDRDVRRDFPAQLYTTDEHLAALCFGLPEVEAPSANAAFAALERRRDLAVTALRLAGFHAFCDPALAGPVLMFNSVRLRRPTVLRATVWQLCVDEQAAVMLRRAADEPRVLPQMQRLLAFAQAPQPDLERTLSLYRRGFDRRFSTPAACAALHFAALESLLGRFGAPGESDSLEALVSTLLGAASEPARAFVAEGRRSRHALAHGRWQHALPPALADTLAAALAAALPRAIDLWLADTASPVRPGARLVRSLFRTAD